MPKSETTSARLSVLETRLTYIEETSKQTADTTKEISKKLDDFITRADRTYATKGEVCDVKVEITGIIKEHQINSKSWIQTVVPWLFAFINLAILIYTMGARP